MKVVKFLRDIILMLYVCVFILLVVCYFLGLSAAVVHTPNEFSNIEVGSLVIFKSEEFFGSLPWFGYVVMWLKTIPGMIIFGLFTALIFGSFIFEIVKNKKNKKVNAANELIENKIGIDEVEENVEDIDNSVSNEVISDEEVKVVENIDDSITNESEDKEDMEFDTMNFDKMNLVDDNIVLNSTLENAESIIEETNEVTNSNIENIDNFIMDSDYGDENIVKDDMPIDVEDASFEEVLDDVDDVNDVDTVDISDEVVEENVEDKYLNNEGGVEDMYMDNIPETENIPEDVIENIEKNLDARVNEAKHEVEDLSQIPDSIDRDTSDFEKVLNSGDLYDNVDYHQMSLADLEAASEDPVLSSMDFSNHNEVAEEIPEDFVENLKKELELKVEEVNILKDKLTSMENLDLAEIDSKMKAIENNNAKLQAHLDEVVKENSLKDEVISELNDKLNTSKKYEKEVENALSNAIDDRTTLETKNSDLKDKLNEYETKMSEFNDLMKSNAKKVENYDLIYERYITTLQYLTKKDPKISKDTVTKEMNTFKIEE